MLNAKNIYFVYGDGADLKIKINDDKPKNHVAFSTTIITDIHKNELEIIKERHYGKDNIFAELTAMYNGLLYMYTTKNVNEIEKVVCYTDNEFTKNILLNIPVEETYYGRVIKPNRKETGVTAVFLEPLIKDVKDLLDMIEFRIEVRFIKGHKCIQDPTKEVSRVMHTKCDNECSKMRKEYLYELIPNEVKNMVIHLTREEKVHLGIITYQEYQQELLKNKKRKEAIRELRYIEMIRELLNR